MDAEQVDRLAQTLAIPGTRRGLLAVVAALLGPLAFLGGLSASRPQEATAAKRPHHPAHRVGQRTQQRRRKRAHEQRLADQDRRHDKLQEDDELGPPVQDQCGDTLRGAGCRFNGDQWLCPRGADLSEALLAYCDLENAELIGVNLSWATLNFANLSGANLSEANVQLASLTGAALYGATFSGTDLSWSKMDSVNLSGVDLSGADLSTVTWFTTICPDGYLNLDSRGTCCAHLNGAVPAACS